VIGRAGYILLRILRGRARLRNQRGMALIAVLLVIAILGLAAAAFLRTSRTGIDVVRGLAEDAKAEALADAGVDWALFNFLSAGSGGEGRATSPGGMLSLAGGTVTVTVEDEAGKIDLNRSSEALLAALFQSVGQSATSAERLAAAIEDFRDPDHERREGGAEDADYEAASEGQGAKDGPFVTASELLQVMSMTRDLFDRIGPSITVHSPRREVDFGRASPSVLNALGLLPGEELKRLAAARGTQPMNSSIADATVISVRAKATSASGARFVRLAILRRTQSLTQPFEVLEWRRVWSMALEPQ
jgi:general secretion pathway protein K